MKTKLKHFAKETKKTFNKLSNIGIRRLAYITSFFIALIFYLITGNETIGLIADVFCCLTIISVIHHCTCGAKMFKPKEQPIENNEDDNESVVLEETFTETELTDLFNGIIMDAVNSESFNKDVVDALEAARDKILETRRKPSFEVEEKKVPTLKHLMNLINPKKKKDKPKRDNEKTADEIVAEVEAMFNPPTPDRTAEEIFNVTTQEEENKDEESDS